LSTCLDRLCIIEELLSKSSAIRVGAEEVAGYTRKRFMDRLTWLRELCRFNASNFYSKRTFERVSHTLENLKLDDSNARLRIQPYCIVLTGYPGTGKSSFAIQIAAAFIRHRYGKFKSSDLVTLNETDEYQSEFRTNHKVVIFDDVGANKLNTSKPSPWRKVIDFVNNIRKTALNPNVDMKGNVYIEPELIIITTNLQISDYQISHWVECPSAIMRRIKKHVLVLPGHKNCQISELVAQVQNTKSTYDYKSEFELQPVMTREEFIEHMLPESMEYMKDQENFVNKINAEFNDDPPKSVFHCFYDDMIEPYLPKKMILTQEIEKRLPIWDRFVRLFCLPSDKIATCQLLEPQSGFEQVKSKVVLEEENAIKSMIEDHSLPFRQRDLPCDEFMLDVIDTKPEDFSLCLHEWENKHGVGDLVFACTHKHTKYYIVVEIKSSNFPKAKEQTEKYANSLHTYLCCSKVKRTQVLLLPITKTQYAFKAYLHNSLIPRPILLKVRKWMIRFQDRCGAIDLQTLDKPWLTWLDAEMLPYYDDQGNFLHKKWCDDL